jgi:hypothetical protein
MSMWVNSNKSLAGQDFFFLSSFASAYTKASLLAAAKADKQGHDTFVSLAAGVAEEQKLHKVRGSKCWTTSQALIGRLTSSCLV